MLLGKLNRQVSRRKINKESRDAGEADLLATISNSIPLNFENTPYTTNRAPAGRRLPP